MDSQKQVLPFEHKKPEYDSSGNFLDVSSYLSAVRNESENSETVVYSRRYKRKFEEIKDEGDDNELILEEVAAASTEIGTKNMNYIREPNEWRKAFVETFKFMKKEFNEKQVTEAYQKKVPSNFTNWRGFMINNEPSHSLLFTLEKSEVLKLIVYLKKLLDDKSVKGSMSRWVLGLFLRLPDILEYSDIFLLRDLAKKLIQNKNLKKSVHTETMMIADMVIVIICDLYGQKDLLPDDLNYRPLI